MTAAISNVITGFIPVQLSQPKSQAEVLDYFSWVIAAHRCRDESVQELEEAQRILDDVKAKVWSYGVSPDFINARQLNALPDELRREGAAPNLPDMMTFDAGPKGSELGEKMLRYKEISRRVFEQAYAEEAERPSTVIHVTCAGYVSPSSAQEFVAERGWLDTGVTHSYHMGCYGAFPPLKMASGFLSNNTINACGLVEDRIDIVHTEYLSLHGDYSTSDPGSIVNMTLFADGFMKYSVVRKDQLKGQSGLEIVAQYETIIPDTKDEMTWLPTAHLFEMYLSKNVPLKIKQNIKGFVTELCRRAGIDFEAQRQELFFAIHPGGPKILDHIVAELGIGTAQMHWSRDVLQELGNMSSATIPHIWQRMLGDIPVGSHVVSMAFGPGLTATGLVLKKV